MLHDTNTVDKFNPNDTLSQKANVSLRLDASLSDRELDSENIPPLKANIPSPKGSNFSSPNKSSYGSCFGYERGSPPMVKTDKSILSSEVLANTSTVNKFNPNDTQSQKTNVLSSVNTSSSNRDLGSENIQVKSE